MQAGLYNSSGGHDGGPFRPFKAGEVHLCDRRGSFLGSVINILPKESYQTQKGTASEGPGSVVVLCGEPLHFHVNVAECNPMILPLSFFLYVTA